MKYSQIREMDNEQLAKHLGDAELELLKLNSQVATGTPPQNPGKIRKLRRTIAKIKTKDRVNKKGG